VGCNYFLLGLNQRPPATSDITMQAIAIHEKAVLSIEMPRAKNAMPRTRKTIDTFRLFSFIYLLILLIIVLA